MKAQQLFQRRRFQARLGLQACELLRELHQGQDPIADEVDGGLVAGHDQQEQRLKRCWSAVGMPSISEVTVRGMGRA